MTDDYSRRKIQVIREFLEAEFTPPYIVASVLAQRDPLADTKFKITLDNKVERTLTVRAVYLTVRAPQSEEDTQVLKAIRVPVSPQ